MRKGDFLDLQAKSVDDKNTSSPKKPLKTSMSRPSFKFSP